MISKNKLSHYTDMPEKTFLKALQNVDWNAFEKHPAQALEKAGVQIKAGMKVQLVDNDIHEDKLDDNTLAVYKKKLARDALENVAGGYNPIRKKHRYFI